MALANEINDKYVIQREAELRLVFNKVNDSSHGLLNTVALPFSAEY